MLIVQNFLTKDYYVSDFTFFSFRVESCVEYQGSIAESASEIYHNLSLKEQIPLIELVALVKTKWYCKATLRSELKTSIVISDLYSEKAVAQKWLDDYMQKLKGE